jgi:uncharacterized membrane protein YgcG
VGYEGDLVAAFFFDQRDRTTDTERIRHHYRQRGFDPAGKIKSPLAKRVGALLGLGGDGRRPASPERRISGRPFGWLVLAAIGLAAAGIARRPHELPVFLGPALAGIVIFVIASLLAAAWRSRAGGDARRAFGFLLLPLVFCGMVIATLLGGSRAGTLTLGALALLAAALAEGVLRAARSRATPEAIALKRDLAAARRYFQAELRGASPGLDDAWFPYLLGLGLGPHVDRWFRAFGSMSSGSATAAAGGGSPLGSSGRAGGGWSGGGGAFGGAGASGSWAAAAGSLAAGVPTPSSSGGGSGGGGGGGGGSSGGGGGGGW